MFITGKIVGFVSQPLVWVLGLTFWGLVLIGRKPRQARLWFTGAFGLLLLVGWLPLPNLLIQYLEQQYAEFAPDADLRAYTGVVVLGGALEPTYISTAHAQPALNGAAERMTSAVSLLQHHPQLHVVFTGGEGELLAAVGPSEAARAKAFFSSLGVAENRVIYESNSRTTYENAVLTAKIPGIDIRQPWLLVTSAWHMPRSMASFAKAGWNVTAYPVDFRSGNATPWTQYSLKQGVARWELALHECIGIAAYWLVGRT